MATPTAPPKSTITDEMADVMHPGAAEEPMSNPVLDPERMKSMAERFRALTGQPKPTKPGEAPKPVETTPPPDSGVKPDAATHTLTRQVAPPVVQAPPPAKPPQTASVTPKPPTPEKPDAPAEPAKVDAPPTDFDPQHLSTNAREGFKRLQQSRDDYKKLAEDRERSSTEASTQLKALQDELAKVKAALPPDIEEMRKAVADRDLYKQQVEDLTKQVETINLERSPRFQNWWKTETDKQIKIAQRGVPPEKREALEKLLKEPQSTERDAKLDELCEGLPNVTTRRVRQSLDEMDTLREKRDDALQHGSEQWKKLKEHEQQEEQAAKQQKSVRLKQLSDAAVERAKALQSFQPKDNDATHNQTVRENEAFVRAFVGGQLDEETMLLVPGLAVESLALKEQVSALQAELAQRDEAIRALQSASPAPRDGGTSQTTTQPPKPGQAFASRYREVMRR